MKANCTITWSDIVITALSLAGFVGVFSTCIIIDFSHYLLSKVLSFPSCVHGEASTPEGGDLVALAGLDLLVQMY